MFERHGWRGTLIALSVVATVARPVAAEASPDDSAAADILYADGTKLLEQGDFERACPKLAESFRLDPALGALLGLAVCRERSGRIASAWAIYLDVVVRATAAGDADRAAAAKERADALAPRLPRLRVDLGPDVASLPGLSITRDGEAIAPGDASIPAPVDPGEHVVVVRATGRRGVEVRVTAFESKISAAAVAELPEESSVAPAPSLRKPSAPDRSDPLSLGSEGISGLQVTGLVTGGIGVVGLGVGLAFGAMAMGAKGDLDDLEYDPESGECAVDPGPCPALFDDAQDAATISTVFVVAGGVLTATGLVLVLAGGKDDPRDSATIEIVPAPLGLTMRGTL